MNAYEITANGTIIGQYEAINELSALDQAASDAGYESISDMEYRLNQDSALVAKELS